MSNILNLQNSIALLLQKLLANIPLTFKMAEFPTTTHCQSKSELYIDFHMDNKALKQTGKVTNWMKNSFTSNSSSSSLSPKISAMSSPTADLLKYNRNQFILNIGNK